MDPITEPDGVHTGAAAQASVASASFVMLTARDEQRPLLHHRRAQSVGADRVLGVVETLCGMDVVEPSPSTAVARATRDDGWLDVKPEVETAWTETCADIADQTLFPRAASWIFGANIPGKKRTVMFYLGGIKEYRSIVSAESASGYPGFLSSADVLAEA